MRKSNLFAAAAVVAGLALAGSAAAANLVTNGSFESEVQVGNFATLYAGDPGLTGWSIDAGSIDWIGDYWVAQDGQKSLDLNGSGFGAISQSITTDVGQRYNLSFWLSANPDYPGNTAIVGVAGLNGTEQTFTFSSFGLNSRSDMKWEQKGLSFVANSANTVLSFRTATVGDQFYYGSALDNVSLSAAVPEPATWAMMILGFFGMGSMVRRRRVATV